MGGEGTVRSPDSGAVRLALGHLCTRGLVPWWVRDKADALLRLRCVVERCTGSEDPDAEVEALACVLRECVGRMLPHSYGQILWIVIDLDGQFPGTNVEERRALAGQRFRKGESEVKATTIRQHHEKRALDRLTEVLMAYERDHSAARTGRGGSVSPSSAV